jgi:hypothetical protein
MKGIKIQRGFLIGYAAVAVIALATVAIVAGINQIGADVNTNAKTGQQQCSGHGTTVFTEISPTTQGGSYTRGLTKVYEIKRADNKIGILTVNAVNNANPDSQSFPSGTQFTLTADLVYTYADSDQVNNPGSFIFVYNDLAGKKELSRWHFDDIPDLALNRHWVDTNDRFVVPANTQLDKTSFDVVMRYQVKKNCSIWGACYDTCGLTIKKALPLVTPTAATPTPTATVSGTVTPSATATATGTPICVNKCGDDICQREVCQGTGCPCGETAKTCPQDCIKSPTPTPSPSGTATRTATSTPVGSPTGTPTDADRVKGYKLLHGWNVVVFPVGFREARTDNFVKQGMTVFEFNRYGRPGWHASTPGGQKNRTYMRRKTGYYVWNPGPDKTVQVTDVNRDNPSVPVIHRGWNLMANSKNVDMALKDIYFRTVLPGLGGECKDPNSAGCKKYISCVSQETNVRAECSKLVSLKSLLEGNVNDRRAWAKLYIIVDPNTGDAKKAFKVTEVTSDNIDTVTLPANKAFWIYLFK